MPMRGIMEIQQGWHGGWRKGSPLCMARVLSFPLSPRLTLPVYIHTSYIPPGYHSSTTRTVKARDPVTLGGRTASIMKFNKTYEQFQRCGFQILECLPPRIQKANLAAEKAVDSGPPLLPPTQPLGPLETVRSAGDSLFSEGAALNSAASNRRRWYRSRQTVASTTPPNKPRSGRKIITTSQTTEERKKEKKRQTESARSPYIWVKY